MPNWCYNKIGISGETENISKIAAILNTKPESLFRALVGIPPEMTEEEYRKDWYETNISYWGTKWDVTFADCDHHITSNYIHIAVETAWSPPIQFCYKLAVMYGVEVDIKYEEQGCDFAGVAACYPDGGITEETYSYLEGLYKTDRDTFWESVEGMIRVIIECGDDKEEFDSILQESFLTETDKANLLELYEEVKEEIAEENKED